MRAVFTVDLFNEGIDIPSVDTLLLLRPTDSPTLFLQQLGRGLRRAAGKSTCTVLDFVGTHRKEFRFDRRLRALLGGSRADVERQVRQDFPFLPAGCSFQLDPVAKEIVLRSIRDAIPSTWRERCDELRSLGDVGLGDYLESSGLDLEDIYAGNHSWSEMRREVGLDTAPAGPRRLRCCARSGDCCMSTTTSGSRSTSAFFATTVHRRSSSSSPREQRLLRMLVSSLTTLRTSASFADAVEQVWAHPQVRAELVEVLELLRERVPYLDHPLGLPDVPLALHSRYTRTEILAAFGVGEGAKPPTWQTGVWWEPQLAHRPLRVHARQERRRLLANDSLPRLRDQPGADPLGEPVGDRRRQRQPASGTSGSARRERTSCCSPGSERPTVPSGASAPRRT